ncbi:MAG TPA: hypothetical protein VGJ21_14815 [Terracidiphilus sp.]
MAKHYVLLTYKEAFGGERPTTEDFRSRLAKLPKSRLVILCGVVNAMLRPKDDRQQFDIPSHDGLVKALLPQQLAAKLTNRAKEIPPRVVFSRQGTLFVAKEALRFANDDGSLPMPNASLGELFLMANDFMHFENLDAGTTDLDKFVLTAAHMIPVQEASDDRVRHKMLRAFQMTSEAALEPHREGGLFFDIPKLFEQVVGISLGDFYALVLAALSRFATFSPLQYMQDPLSFVLQEGWFASTTVQAISITAFFEYVSASEAAFEPLIAASPARSDFTAFRKKPLLQLPGGLTLIDLWFLAEKYEVGPFWSILKSLEKKDGDQFSSFWGLLFERYMSNLLASSSKDGYNAIYATPKFEASGEEVCDVIIVCDRSVVFIELKGATFSAGAKYSGDVGRLRAELESKLVQSSDREQAVNQLARNIHLVFGPQKAAVHGIDLGMINVVYPLVITRDSIGAVVGVNAFLDHFFKTAINRDELAVSVAPLICMSSDNAEALSAYLNETTLAAILKSHIAANKSLGRKHIISPLFTVPNRELDKFGERQIPNQQAQWNALMTEALARLGLREPSNV